MLSQDRALLGRQVWPHLMEAKVGTCTPAHLHTCTPAHLHTYQLAVARSCGLLPLARAGTPWVGTSHG